MQYGEPIRRFFLSGLDGYVFHSKRKGLIFPEKLQSFILVSNFICLVILLFLATFLSLLDNFSENHAESITVRVLLAVSLASFSGHLFMRMTNQSYSAGRKTVYLRKIVQAYAEEKRLFVDIGQILLICAVLIIPTQKIIGGILFVSTLIIIIFYSNDLIKVEVSHIVTEKQRLTYEVFKIFFFNILFAHTMGSILLAMARL